MQHLTVLTSKRNSLFDSKGRFHWTMSGVGLEFNHLFGFGVLDAGAMVALAKQWKTVPPRYHCEGGSDKATREIPSDKSLFLTIETAACAGSTRCSALLSEILSAAKPPRTVWLYLR